MKISSEQMLAVIGQQHLEVTALQGMLAQANGRIAELEAQVAELQPTPETEPEAAAESGVCI